MFVSPKLILRIVNMRWEEQNLQRQRLQREQPSAQHELINGLTDQVRGQPCSCIDRGVAAPPPGTSRPQLGGEEGSGGRGGSPPDRCKSIVSLPWR